MRFEAAPVYSVGPRDGGGDLSSPTDRKCFLMAGESPLLPSLLIGVEHAPLPALGSGAPNDRGRLGRARAVPVAPAADVPSTA